VNYLVRGGLVLVLLVGLPTWAYALNIGGMFTDFFKAIAALFKLLVGLTVLIWIICLLVKKK
jgi:hypothetical protein